MPIDLFAVVAQPHRRRVLEHLRLRDASVGELVELLELPQPAVSKHLKVLRDSGFVTSRVAAQQRLYSLNPAPLQELDAWLEPYRQLWTRHLDALGQHLQRKELA